MRRTTIGLALATLILWAPSALARGGGYVGFGIGGATVDGKGYVNLRPPTVYDSCPSTVPQCRDRVHTTGGDGLALQVLFGYNFFGYAALEANIAMHGNPDSGQGKWEGAGHVAGLVRLYPAQFVNLAPQVDIGSRWWDPNVYVGAGYSFMGYHAKYRKLGESTSDTARGWEGSNVQVGFGSDFYLTKTVVVGADFRFILPRYEKYHEDWGDVEYSPTPKPTKALIFAPMVTVTFHFADPLPREAVKPIVKQ